MPGHVHKRTHQTKSGKESVLYYAVVELPQIGGKRKQDWGTGFRRKKDAETALVEKLARINAGEVVARGDDPGVGSASSADWGADWGAGCVGCAW